MIFSKIPYNLDSPLYYSSWQPTGNEHGQSIDFNLAEQVMFILDSSSTGTHSSISVVAFHLTEIIDISEWAISNVENMPLKLYYNDKDLFYIIEDQEGVRYKGIFESLNNELDGIKVNGSFCIFSDSRDETIVETFGRILNSDTYNRSKQGTERYENIKKFIEYFEPVIKEYYPERYLQFISNLSLN